MSGTTFQELVQRLRRGDAEAARELVRQYEGEIRRAIRVRLTDPNLRRSLDSMDICQSVMANFFFRVSIGQFDLDNPAQLLALLLRMANNKLIDHARRETSRRAGQRLGGVDAEVVLETAPAAQETPSEVVAGRELLERARQLLSPDERYVAEQRASGRSWAELGQELNREQDAVRKQYARAMNRVAEQLGLGVLEE